MKTTLLPFFTFVWIFCCLYSLEIQCKVITVSNDPNTLAQYTDLQIAIDEAEAGDTIYVHGSETDYGSITFNKRLTFIGPGYYGLEQQLVLPTLISELFIERVSAEKDPSNSFFVSIRIKTITVNSDQIIGVTFERCRLEDVNLFNFSEFTFKNCIIKRITLTNNSDGKLVISNNIFETGTNGSFSGFETNTGNVAVANNLFIGPRLSQTTGSISVSSIKHVTFANNIFYGVSAYNENNMNCTFNSNITFGSENTALFIEGSNSGSGNLINTDPDFVKIAPNRFTLEWEDDYHLSADSPGKNKGTDNTDIGIYGGSDPFPATITGEPAIPQIRSFDLQDTVLNSGDTLKFNAVGEANQ